MLYTYDDDFSEISRGDTIQKLFPLEKMICHDTGQECCHSSAFKLSPSRVEITRIDIINEISSRFPYMPLLHSVYF